MFLVVLWLIGLSIAVMGQAQYINTLKTEIDALSRAKGIDRGNEWQIVLKGEKKPVVVEASNETDAIRQMVVKGLSHKILEVKPMGQGSIV